VKFSEIAKDDCIKLADFLTSLRAVKMPEANMLSMVHFVDGLRWVQEAAQGIARAYADEQKELKFVDETAKKDFTIKSYVPGAIE